jgi:hypothetical protein
MTGMEMADLVHGEQPTLYQWVQKQNRRSNSIVQAIRDAEGHLQVTQSGIAATFVAFFQNQYVTIGADTECTDKLLEHIDMRLTADLDLALMTPYTGDEIRAAVRAGGMNRAPGLDGLGIGLYRATWDLIRDDMVDLYNAMFF